MDHPSEFAAMVVFLASVHATFVYGATINVGGRDLSCTDGRPA
jgi:NAD(P)-dependent dehydrogenase (short-subunit alcohol dehydrogenase family)